ncbi:MAG: BON domain-containing protein [Planctomycetales bacterium]|nr:BON domain-containing protein [Planctomycetales bacterium]
MTTKTIYPVSQNTSILLDNIHDALSQSPYLTRKLVHCEEMNGRVIVKGRVGTYFQKQMATEVLRNIDGVEQIENRLEVVWR